MRITERVSHADYLREVLAQLGKQRVSEDVRDFIGTCWHYWIPLAECVALTKRRIEK